MNEEKISSTRLIPKTISNFGSLISLMEYDGDEINQTTSIGIATGHLKNLAGDLAEINELASKNVDLYQENYPSVVLMNGFL